MFLFDIYATMSPSSAKLEQGGASLKFGGAERLHPKLFARQEILGIFATDYDASLNTQQTMQAP